MVRDNQPGAKNVNRHGEDRSAPERGASAPWFGVKGGCPQRSLLTLPSLAAILPLPTINRNDVAVPDNSSPRRYVFAGGGTAGHLFPAIVVADALRARDPEAAILFIGSDRPREHELVASHGYAHESLPLLPTSQAKRHPFRFARALWSAHRRAQQLLTDTDIVVGVGGLASVPTVWAARRSNCPVVLLEQNVFPGRATRRLARRGDAVCLAFDESREWLPSRTNAIVTGNPVRAEIAALTESPATASPGSPLLLILGGTLGANSINTAVLTGLQRDPDSWHDWSIVHQTGEANLASVRAGYEPLPLSVRVEAFLPDIPTLLARATIVVTRAGATTLAELACAAPATVVVPWRQSTDDHQTLNARWYADRKAMLIAPDPGSSPGNQQGVDLFSQIELLRQDPKLRQQLSQMLKGLAQPGATERVIEVVDAR